MRARRRSSCEGHAATPDLATKGNPRTQRRSDGAVLRRHAGRQRLRKPIGEEEGGCGGELPGLQVVVDLRSEAMPSDSVADSLP